MAHEYKGTRHPETNKTIDVHRMIVEEVLGRSLPSSVEVHHINEDKRDNRHENLVVCQDRAYHTLIHKRTRAYDACGNANWLKCNHCKQYDDPKNLRVYKTYAVHKDCVNAYVRKQYWR